MIFKIKLEDKAAFLNRMETTDKKISSNQIKDNNEEKYFELVVTNPEQLEIVKSILNTSTKINTIKEMKKSLTRSELKEMIRQELNEKKKIEDKKKKIDEATGAEMAAKQLMGAISNGDPFLTGVALVGAVVAGVFAGPKVAQTLKGYYKALTTKDPAKAEKLKDAAKKANIDVTEEVA
jgi:hypothetical protein